MINVQLGFAFNFLNPLEHAALKINAVLPLSFTSAVWSRHTANGCVHWQLPPALEVSGETKEFTFPEMQMGWEMCPPTLLGV